MAERERCIGSSTDTMRGRGVGIDAVQGIEEVAFMYIAFTPAIEDGDTGTIEGTECTISTDTEGSNRQI
jgi:hypothetical protein